MGLRERPLTDYYQFSFPNEGNAYAELDDLFDIVSCNEIYEFEGVSIVENMHGFVHSKDRVLKTFNARSEAEAALKAAQKKE